MKKKEICVNGGKLEKHCWSTLASLLRAFRQRRKNLRRRSEDEENVLVKIETLMCVVRKMSATGRSGKGLRCNVSQLAEICKQGWMNDMYEVEEWEVWLTKRRREKEKKAERLEQYKVWLKKHLERAEGGAGMLQNFTTSLGQNPGD